MLKIFGCIAHQHDPVLFGLAIFCCLLTTAGALLMMYRARDLPEYRHAMIWHLSAGMFAAVGLWVTHFVAMIAYKAGVPVTYTLSSALLSLGVSIIFQSVIAWRLGHDSYKKRVTVPYWTWGVLSALGVATMHFIGMSGFNAPGILVWDNKMIAASLFAGCAAGGLAVQLHARASTLLTKTAQIGLMIVSVLALHFGGMAALTIIPIDSAQVVMNGVDKASLALVVAFCACLILFVGSLAVLADQQRLQENDELRQALFEESNKMAVLAQQQALLRKQAETANIAKSTFLATMSHELRTPLNAIIGYGELIREDAEAEDIEATRQDASQIVTAAQRLLGVIDDVLDISMIESSQMSLNAHEFDVASLTQVCAGAMQRAAFENGNSLRTQLEDQLPVVVNDAKRVKQCLTHLLSNAAKFTTNGVITLRVRAAEFHDTPCIAFDVIDTGVGIAPEHRTKLFQPFSQIDGSDTRRHGGAGVGLAISRRLARLMGGDILVESEPGQGSTFTLIVAVNWSESTALNGQEYFDEFPREGGVDLFTAAA